MEEDETVILTMAAYIDLNPVRAGLVKDPKDHRWCGYGEAASGNKERRRGLMRIYGEESSDGRKWRGYQAQYRLYLYGVGEERQAVEGYSAKGRAGVSAKAAERVRRGGGQLSLSEVVRVRIRYFTESVAFGTRKWVAEVFDRNREKLKVKRERGAREPKLKELGDWRGLIDLRGQGESRILNQSTAEWSYRDLQRD